MFSNYLNRFMILAAGVAVLLSIASIGWGQRPRFPDFFQNSGFTQNQAGQQIVNPAQAIQQPIVIQQPGQSTIPSVIGPPPAVFSPGPTTITQPGIDPFARAPLTPFGPGNRGTNFNIYPPASSQPILGPADTAPALNTTPQPTFDILPPQGSVQQFPPPNAFQPNQFPNPSFQPNPAYANQGSFFNSSRWPSVNWAWPSQAWARLRSDVIPRVLERPRFRHTWIYGSTGNELDIHDTELTTTLTLPFANLQPLRITPGFSFHFWNGPETPVTGFDLPSRAYSAFLAIDHVTDPSRRAGIENNFTIGVYSDFEHLNSDSLRFTGVILGWLKLNEINTFKVGVEYLDRLDLKLLPAFGVFIQPTPDIRLDVYFPRPRLAQRLPNFRNLEVWSYVGGEYGGGSWTIERIGGLDDQVDINDVRAFVGLEWSGPRRVTGFIETGYVFERDLVYRTEFPAKRLELKDSFMLRLGMAF